MKQGGTMKADQVEVSWDTQKSKWAVRIQAGEEVVRRFCDLPKNADDTLLRQSALKTVSDEGYEVDGPGINIRRLAS
jgi:hypothetical protein